MNTSGTPDRELLREEDTSHTQTPVQDMMQLMWGRSRGALPQMLSGEVRAKASGPG